MICTRALFVRCGAGGRIRKRTGGCLYVAGRTSTTPRRKVEGDSYLQEMPFVHHSVEALPSELLGEI